MAVDVTVVSGRVMRALGLTDTGTSFGSISSTATQYNTTDITKAVVGADKLVFLAGILTAGHFWRRGAITATAVTHGSLLPAHIGPVFGVTFTVTGGARPGIRPAKLATLEEIDWDNGNPNAGTLLTPKYAIVDEKIYFNREGLLLASGVTVVAVTADLATYTPSSSVCISPDEAEDAVFHGAMRSLQPLDGQNMEVAGGWNGMFLADIKLLGISPQALAQAQGMGVGA